MTSLVKRYKWHQSLPHGSVILWRTKTRIFNAGLSDWFSHLREPKTLFSLNWRNYILKEKGKRKHRLGGHLGVSTSSWSYQPMSEAQQPCPPGVPKHIPVLQPCLGATHPAWAPWIPHLSMFPHSTGTASCSNAQRRVTHLGYETQLPCQLPFNECQKQFCPSHNAHTRFYHRGVL